MEFFKLEDVVMTANGVGTVIRRQDPQNRVRVRFWPDGPVKTFKVFGIRLASEEETALAKIDPRSYKRDGVPIVGLAIAEDDDGDSEFARQVQRDHAEREQKAKLQTRWQGEHESIDQGR